MRAIDLTGKNYERLTVFELAGHKGKKRLWRCPCKCGGETLATTSDLISGHTRSCGCLWRELAGNVYFRKAAAKRRYRQREIIERNGKEYYAARKAARDAQVSVDTLARWANRRPDNKDNYRGCPALGRAIVSITEWDRGQECYYYLGTDIDEAIEAKARLAIAPNYDGLIYITSALQECGVSRETFRRAIVKRSSRAPVVSRKRAVRQKDGHPCMRSYVDRTFVEEYKRDRGGPADPDAISVHQAAELLHLTPNGVHSALHRGALTWKTRRVISAAGYPCQGRVLSRREVEAYRDRPKGRWANHHKTQDAAVPVPVSIAPIPLPTITPFHDPRPRGRKASAAVMEVYEFCYKRYIRGDRLANIREDAVTKFGYDRAPKDDAHVTLYAKRYASRMGLPLHRPNP